MHGDKNAHKKGLSDKMKEENWSLGVSKLGRSGKFEGHRGRRRTSAECGSTEPYGRPLSEMQMTAGLLLRFPKQILTPAGAGALSDSGTSLSSTISFRCYLFKLDKWIIVRKKREKRQKVRMKGCTVHIKERENMTGALTGSETQTLWYIFSAVFW